MKYFKLLILPICLLFSFSCDDDEPFDFSEGDAEFGAVPRLVSLFSDEFDLENTTEAIYSHEVEFITEDGGNNVEVYEIVVEYIDNSISNGDNSRTSEVYMNLQQEDFGTSQFGNRNAIVDISFLDLTSLLNIDPATVEPGDEFGFNSSLILNDGRVFNSDNSESFENVVGVYFDWTVRITCPVDNSLFTGLYAISYEVGGNDLIGPAYNNGEVVELVPVDGSNTLREFSAELLPNLNPTLPAITRFELFCDMAVYVSADTGIDCNGIETDNSINFGPAIDLLGNPLSVFLDLTNDSQIILFVNEGADPGNCSLNNTQSRLTLTKM